MSLWHVDYFKLIEEQKTQILLFASSLTPTTVSKNLDREPIPGRNLSP